MNKIKELLSESFGDSVTYLDFLEKIGYLRSEEAFAIFNEDRPVSVLFVKKYPLNLAYGTGWADYIFYAATSPEHRGKGLMGKLLTDTLSTLKTRGGDCAVLIPAERSLFDFYSKFGFETAFYIDQKEFLPVDNGAKIYIPSEVEANKFYPRYFDKYGKRKNTIYKSEEIFYQSVSENLFDTESSAVLTDGNSFAFASFGDKIILREPVSDDISSFAKAVAFKYGKTVTVSLPTENRGTPLGMIFRYNGNSVVPPLYMDNMLN
ncbi:MAG: GNAT family N-acetyltransferase [Clostridia bacterium]|nr:GNAT family N-acetyltransferase [Clostridia bacterium]